MALSQGARCGLFSFDVPFYLIRLKAHRNGSIHNHQIEISFQEIDEETVVIIGASHAGLTCSEAVRKNSFESDIIVCERDDGLPLQRPPFSKLYFDAEVSDGDNNLLIRRPDWFTQFDIKFLEKCPVAKIERTKKIVFLSGNHVLPYDRLVIALGAYARRLLSTGGPANGVLILRTADDAHGLQGSLEGVQNAVVIGCRYIRLEVAASLRKAGKDVRVVELAPQLLSRFASPALYVFCTKLHATAGLNISTNTVCDKILTDQRGHVKAVRLADVTELTCQPMLASIGVIPDSHLAKKAGLPMDNGIMILASYRSLDPAIWAIGDFANAPHRYVSRIESIHHVQLSARNAAADMLGTTIPTYEALWFWSDQCDVKFQMAGVSPICRDGALQYVSRVGRREGSLSNCSCCESKLVTAKAANDGQAYMIGKKYLQAGISSDPADIENTEFTLKTLLSQDLSFAYR